MERGGKNKAQMERPGQTKDGNYVAHTAPPPTSITDTSNSSRTLSVSFRILLNTGSREPTTEGSEFALEMESL